MTTWREDQHIEIGHPSLTIIPPTVIHTSRNREPNGRLVDIFSPPRVDFSRTPGLVINAADYPMPVDA
jgi:mannose-6-phosphate isomerase-like protein (cupin superfamily)